MNIITRLSIIVMLMVPFISFAQESELNLIPKPQSVQMREGRFTLDENTTIKGNAQFAIKYLQDKIKNSADICIAEKQDAAENFIEININAQENIKKEGYSLSVCPDRITITASDNGGAFYGVQTLLQMLPSSVYGKASGWENWTIQCSQIEDYPRFGYRGAGLDVSRTFFPLETIYNFIDWISYHKINTFHWHLTDDNGWRIEIKKYPLLTQKGAWRGPDEVLPPAYGSGNKRYGGFYTQEEIKKVVKYAADRNITIIPEIDMPGHSKAIIHTYPQVGCTNENKEMSVNGEVNNVWCIGNEKSYVMIENIIKELITLFPSKLIHIGGDEVNMDNWKNCPCCQAFMKKEGMNEEIELLNYFVRKMEKIVNKYNRSIIGWDEIIKGGELQPSTVVYGWGSMKRGADAVRKGQPTVFLPGQYCYLDMKQSQYERGHNWAAIVTLDSTYKIDPIKMNDFTPEQEKLVLGIQGNLWTELLNRPARFLEYQFFPRLCALAEAGWTNAENKDYNNFFYRLTKSHYERMQNMGIAFRLPYPEVKYENNTLKVELPYEWAVVRYTTDGTEPSISSKIYTGDIVTFEPEKFRFATFFGNFNKSISVGASNIELHKYITPEVDIESSYSADETNNRFPVTNATSYDFSKYWRINRRSQAGDYVLYTFREPVECSTITVETGIPNITFYSVTDGHVEYSYNGKEFIKGDKFVNGTAVIRPNEKVKAVKIVFTGMSDALITAFQNLKIEE